MIEDVQRCVFWLGPRLARAAYGGPAIIWGGGSSTKRYGMNDVADEVLVRRVAQSGDERAPSELYGRYAALIYGAGMRYLRNWALAEDLV